MSDRPKDDSTPSDAGGGWRTTGPSDEPPVEPTAPDPEPTTPPSDSLWRPVERRDTASWQRVSERDQQEEPAEPAPAPEVSAEAAAIWRRPDGSEPAAEPAEADETATEAEAEVLPFEAEHEAVDGSDTLELEDDEDDDSFSMSELVALASLADAVPAVPVEDAPPPKPDDGSDLDPAEYARQQMERLRGGVAVEEPEAEVARRNRAARACASPGRATHARRTGAG